MPDTQKQVAIVIMTVIFYDIIIHLTKGMWTFFLLIKLLPWT